MVTISAQALAFSGFILTAILSLGALASKLGSARTEITEGQKRQDALEARLVTALKEREEKDTERDLRVEAKLDKLGEHVVVLGDRLAERIRLIEVRCAGNHPDALG